MPLLYAIEGISAPYAKITAIEPAGPAFAATLQSELLKPNLGQSQTSFENNHPKKPSALKGYSENTSTETPERKPVLFAHDLMTKSVFHLNGAATLSEARALMQKEHIQHLPILDGQGILTGILSDRDVLRAGSNLNRPISSQMTANVLTATPDTAIQDIAEAMLVHEIHAMPVVNTDLHIVGILTSTDILRAIVRHTPLALWA